MENLDKAMEIIAMRPMPDDAEDQIEALADQSPDAERVCIESLFEALFVARHTMSSDV